MEPSLRLEKWQNFLKKNIAKERFSIDILREAHPDKLTLPPEPMYEEGVDNSAALSERNLKVRNEQLKNTWLNKYQNIEASGRLCGDKP